MEVPRIWWMCAREIEGAMLKDEIDDYMKILLVIDAYIPLWIELQLLYHHLECLCIVLWYQLLLRMNSLGGVEVFQ